MAESIKEHAKRLIVEEGPLPDENGNPAYDLAEKAAPRKFKPEKTAEVVDLLLANGLPERTILACSEVNLTKVLDAYADTAPRGKKGAFRGELETKLQEIDAIKQGESTRYVRKLKVSGSALKDS